MYEAQFNYFQLLILQFLKIPFPRRLLMLPEWGCALPGEGLCCWGGPCTPLQTLSSILDLQTEPTAQPRAEQLDLPRVSDSHPTACSQTRVAAAQTQQIFLIIRDLLETSAPRRAGQSHSQSIPTKGTFKDHALLLSFSVTPR